MEYDRATIIKRQTVLERLADNFQEKLFCSYLKLRVSKKKLIHHCIKFE